MPERRGGDGSSVDGKGGFLVSGVLMFRVPGFRVSGFPGFRGGAETSLGDRLRRHCDGAHTARKCRRRHLGLDGPGWYVILSLGK